MIGLNLQGNILNINSINFTIDSDAGPSCTNQLKIDFTKDGLIESGNSRVSDAQACNYLKTRGCFSGNKTLSEFTIGTYPNKHCQRIKLTESPGFKLGAWINPSGDTRNLSMGLYNLYGEKLKDCKLPLVNQIGEYSCDVEYLVTESQEYFVCIYSEKDQGTSKIRGYQDAENGCGFYGSDIGLEIASFEIFAQGKSFDSIGKINITSYLEGQISLNNKSIFTQKIFVERIPILQSIKPTKTVTGYPTDFKINAETFENSTIVKYEWNFGGNRKNIN